MSKRSVPTAKQCDKLYAVACGGRAAYGSYIYGKDDIRADMRSVVAAKNISEALKFIFGWGGWARWQAYESAKDCARAIRKAWRDMRSAQ